eukprot:scaffold1834_cov175-Amphora_coffeaeformis.AAC.11
MEECELSENCRNSSNMNVCNEDKVSSLPLLSTPSCTKRKTAAPSALRSTRPSSRKLRKIDEDVDASFTADQHFPNQTEVTGEAVMTVMEMNNRIKQLFSDSRVLLLPCTSARLFACFSLVAESNAAVEDTPQRSTRRQKSQGALEPIIPFLRALVQTEVSSLELDATEATSRDRPRRIAFSGFDCSSTKPPVDRVDGSGEHQSNSIQALSTAKDALDALISNKKIHSFAIFCLEKLIEFMTLTLREDKSLQMVCAASMSSSYPIERLNKPIKLYAGELGGIVRRLRGQHGRLFVERRLNELLCNSTRYHLRLLLNPPPPRLSPLDINYEQRSKSFSRIHELVELTVVDDNKKVVPLDGERVASLVNEALMQICLFFGFGNLLDPTSGIPVIDQNFCQTEASQRQVPKNNKVRLPPLSPSEVEELQDDMNYAFQVLITLSATNFLLDLMSLPKVVSEIKRLGGWGDVETYATLLWRYELWDIHPDCEHFVLLSNFKTLTERLASVKEALREAGEVANVSLKDLGDRFRINATKKNKTILRQFYPEINIVDEALEEGWKAVHAFPTVREI